MNTSASRAWAVALQSVVLVLSVLGAGYGASVVAEDMSDRSDDWDGFAAALGGIFAGWCVVLLVLSALALSQRSRRPGSFRGLTVATAIVGYAPFVLVGILNPVSLVVGAPFVLLFAFAVASKGRDESVVDVGVGWGTR